jgi:predicted kinase
MKAKIQPVKPSVIMLYGYPGSGKTTFAKNLSEEISYAHIDTDRILAETTNNSSRISDKEAFALMTYIANEFIKAGVGVIFDLDLPREIDRRRIKDFAKKQKLKYMIVWPQIDIETSENRATSRDKRKTEDRFAKPYTKESFRSFVGLMQNPLDENTIVISGKHTFQSQKAAVIKKLLQSGVIKSEELSNRIVKPGLMSLVPKPTLSGENQPERRNISIN